VQTPAERHEATAKIMMQYAGNPPTFEMTEETRLFQAQFDEAKRIGES
jgi:hypothetical protein